MLPGWATLTALVVLAQAAPQGYLELPSPRTSPLRNYARAAQRYEPQHGRRTRDASDYQPIRIRTAIGTTDQLSSTMRTFLDTLIAAAVSRLTQTLSVVPVSGSLLVNRTCCSEYSSGVCAAACAVPTCADGSSGELPVDATLLRGLRTCNTCYTDGTCDEASCTETSDGAGAPATDFYLYVSSVTTASCGGGTIAYASACYRDQYDRPIMGSANFCPDSLSSAAADWDDQLGTAVHEVFHALGFSSDSWALFRDESGAPRTPRDADGNPAEVSATCADGSVRSVRAPGSSTVAASTERGVTVHRLVTPRVASVARDLFGCASLSGAELENQPTGSSSPCFGSHWEQRIHMNEMMTSTLSENILSPLTLAALED